MQSPKILWREFESPVRSAVTPYPKPTYRSVIKLDRKTYITNPSHNTRYIQRIILRHLRNSSTPSKYSLHGRPKGFDTLKRICATYDYIGCDLANTYEQISYTRVVGLLRNYDLLPPDVFAPYCVFKSYLARGSICSNYILELLLRRFDFRCAGLAKKHGLKYLRYIDDLRFYGDLTVTQVPTLLKNIRSVVKAEGFALNNEKTRIEYLER